MATPPPPTPPPLAVLRGHTAAVNDVDFHPTTQHLLSGAADGEVRLWDVGTRRTTSSTVAHAGAGILAVIFGGGDSVYTHGRDGAVAVWSIGGGDWRAVTMVPCTSYSFCRTIHDPITETLVLPTEDGKVEVHDLRSGAAVRSYGANGRDKTGLLMHLCLGPPVPSSGRRCLYAGYESGHVAVWDWAGPDRPLLFEQLHEEPVLAVQCRPDGAQLATGGADKKFRLLQWQADSSSLQPQASYEYSHGASSCCFRHDSRLVAVGCWDHGVRLYDAKKRKPLAVLRHHTGPVNAVRYDATGLLASAAGDGLIALWRLYPT